LFESSLQDIDAHLRLEFLIPEPALAFLDHLHVPLDEWAELGAEVAEVLRVLCDQVRIATSPLERVLHECLVLSDFLEQFVSDYNPEIFLDAEFGDIDLRSWVNVAFEVEAVLAGILEVFLQTVLLDQVTEFRLRVVQMIRIGLKMVVILSQEH